MQALMTLSTSSLFLVRMFTKPEEALRLLVTRLWLRDPGMLPSIVYYQPNKGKSRKIRTHPTHGEQQEAAPVHRPVMT